MLYTSLREKAPLFEIRGFLSPNRSAGDTLRCAVIAESPAERSPRELNGAEEGGVIRRVQHVPCTSIETGMPTQVKLRYYSYSKRRDGLAQPCTGMLACAPSSACRGTHASSSRDRGSNYDRSPREQQVPVKAQDLTEC